MQQVSNFLPSQNGLHYINRWPDAPDLTVETPFGPIEILHASGGLCGGMAFGVRDLFQRRQQPLASTQNPTPDTPAFHYLATRLLQSFDLPWGVLKFYEWMASPDKSELVGKTLQDELPVIRQTIDQGLPCPIGLVRILSKTPSALGENHQVLVWGYDETGNTTRLALYDPNWPDRNDVAITWDHTLPLAQIQFKYSTGEPLFGLFAMHYEPRDPAQLLIDQTVLQQPGGEPPMA